MKILIPTYNRPKTHKTAQTLYEGGVTDWCYVLHNDDEYVAYRNHWPAGVPFNAVVSGVPLERGLGGQRAKIESSVPLGTWYIQMDDNVERFTKLTDPEYHEPRIYLSDWDRKEIDAKYNTTITPEEFMHEVIPELQAQCELYGTGFGGFATTQNTFMRGKKWTKIGFVVGKVMLMLRSDSCCFNPSYFTSDDYQYSAEALLAYGTVARNNYVYPCFPRYMSGGLGRLPERQVPYARAAQQLLKDYPGAFRINYDRKDMDPGSAVKFVFTDRSEKSLERWREIMRDLRAGPEEVAAT